MGFRLLGGTFVCRELRFDRFFDFVVAHEPITRFTTRPSCEIKTDVGSPTNPPTLSAVCVATQHDWVIH